MIEKIQPNFIPKNLKDQGVVVEKELSPEIIKKILEKVKDINSNGTAYTAIGRIPFPESLENTQNEGKELFSFKKNLEKKQLINIFKKGASDALIDLESSREYKEKIKQKKGGVMFNIIGKSSYYDNKNERSITKSIQHGGESNYMEIPGQVGLIFDLKKFKESERFVSGAHIRAMATDNLELNTFHPRDDIKLRLDDKIYPDEEVGFILHPRVAPRDFQGLLLNLYKHDLENKIRIPFDVKDYKNELINGEEWMAVFDKISEFYKKIKGGHEKLTEDDDKKIKVEVKNLWNQLMEIKNKQFVENVARTLKEAYSDKPDLLIPIYDIEGNLLWPVEMKYDKVKEFVENNKKES